MKTELYGFFILLSVVIVNAELQKLCSNGVFKCVSPISLRICFHDKLVTSEFFCPNLTFCNENSPTICTKLRAALPVIQYHEVSATTDANIYPVTQCTEQGVFEVENSGCTTFLNCSNLEEIQESTCDEVSLFNPETKTCSEDYTCPETLDYIHSYEDCLETSNSFICTKVGNFLVPNTNCEKFIYCKRINNGFKAIQKSCPSNNLFDPKAGRCVRGYICKDTCATTTPFEAFSTTVMETTPEDSPCPGVGRFPVPNTNCTTFRLCANTSNGMMYKEYTCPLGSYYDPSTTKCSTKYKCWPDITSTVPTITDDFNTTLYQSSTASSSTIQETTTVTDNSTIFINETTFSDDTSTSTFTPSIINTTAVSEEISPNPTGAQDITTSSITITTEGNITEDISSGTIKEANVTDLPITITSDDRTPTSSDDQETTTSSNPISTEQDLTPNSSDVQDTTTSSNPITTTPNTDLPTTTDKTTIITCGDFSENTGGISDKTGFTEETSSHSINDETTTSSNEFTTPTIDCRNQGRLPVSNTKCKLYYQCTLTTNGYQYKIYTCSEGTLFDPYKKICSALYTCPDTIPNTSTDKTISEPQESTSTVDNTKTDSDESNEEITINCTQQGKIPIPNANCQLYGKCTLTTNGFIQNIYECPKGSFYDPEMKICSASYECPETISLSTTDKVITTTVLNNPSTNPLELSSSFTTVPLSTTTEIENPSPIVPSCTEQGKFPILNTRCKSYLSCILTTSGFISTEYICSGNLLFDPNLKKCSSKYICKEESAQSPKSQEIESTKEEEELTKPPIKPEFGKCTASGKFPIPYSKCTQFIICSSTSTGFRFKIYTCPINSFYDPENKRCSQTYSCSEVDATSTTEAPQRITTTTDLDIPECHVNGKFSVNNTGCRDYILCISTSTGFKSKIYSCPDDTFFNPDMKRCQKEYICPELSTDTETTKVFSSEESSEECIDVDVLKEIPDCTKTGKFSITGTNCKQYILCTQTSLGFRSKIYSCPNDSNFDPVKHKCTRSYNCTEKICNVDVNKTKAAKLIKKPIVSTCNSPGKFLIKGTDCKIYKLCVWTNFGYTETVYDCPEGTYFNQKTQSCSENYICTEDNLYNCTTIGQFKDLSDTTCQYYISCKANADGIVRGERNICPRDYYFDPVIQKCSAFYMCREKRRARAIEITPKFLVNGQCTTVGRYTMPSTNCKKYMYCADNGGGTLKGTQFTCPTTTVFNQAIQKCTATYICPDSVCGCCGPVANPNSKDCTSYIECETNYDPITGLSTTTGRVVFCPLGQKFDPIFQYCSSTYVCPL